MIEAEGFVWEEEKGRKSPKAMARGSGGLGGGPPGVDDDGFRTAAKPDEESQGSHQRTFF